ncbi:cytochrome P450 4d2-like [Cydia pomonella]|uniref:CYP341V1 n=1 Tax=Cydia pomonella TaxID=82600 RepID=A0A8D4P6Y7_CYDPO|nr:cytochrome P450 4d2-like [Cydia pomonella]XP_061725561.1 cytochrome P450 4d2-like [Cydia pomonella]XP_061725562.1 cytochrome P450 4d2-like [Cydia pomonella]AZJ25114.1 CYP341V1 [Cydia pomonella]
MFWPLLLLAAAIAAALYTRQRRPLYAFSKAYPFGLPNYPLIGQSYIFRGTDEDRMNAFIKMGDVSLKNGGITTVWLGTKPYATISDPELLEVVAKACLDKDTTTMKYLRSVLGNGLIFAPIKIWRPRRKIMAPTFNMKNLQEFVTVFDKQSSIMVQQLRAHAGGGDFSFWEFITAYTFDAICETVLGIELNAQKQRHHLFITAFDVIIQILAKRMLSPWLYWDWVFRLTSNYKPFITQRKIAYDFFDKVIRDRRKELAEQGADEDLKDRKKTFLDMMIVSSGGARGYTDIELREEIMSIVSAGTDTSAVGTAFVALMLSRHPRVQDKVYQELKEVFGDSDRPVTWQDLPKLKYMEAVIKETLRLYPPAPVVVRDVHETVVLPNGATLHPGMGLVLHFWATHRNTKYWGDDVEEFRPERFLEGPLKHPAQFAPFSYSLRNCIGGNYAIMSTKTNLSNLLRRYEVLPPLSVPPDQLLAPFRVKFDVMMKHCDNFELRIRNRHNGLRKK